MGDLCAELIPCYANLSTVLVVIVLPVKEDLWQSLSYVASWKRGRPGSFDNYGWLRGERRACHNKVITPPQRVFQVPLWQLRVVSIATNSKQWPWWGFCQNRTRIVALWLDTFILCFTSSIFRSSLAHLLGIIFEWNYRLSGRTLPFKVMQWKTEKGTVKDRERMIHICSDASFWFICQTNSGELGGRFEIPSILKCENH